MSKPGVTYDSFLATLREMSDWRFRADGSIYCGPTGMCAWRAAAFHHLGGVSIDYNIYRDGRWANLAIWLANDNTSGHDPDIRQDLLRACGPTS